MRVAIVGGGIVGLCCAHYLKEAGADVTVVDGGLVGAGCSAGNAGWISPSISFPLPAPGLTATSLRWLLKADSPLYIKPAALPALLPWLLRFRRFCNHSSFARGAAALADLGTETLKLFEELVTRGVRFEHRREGLLMLFRQTAEIDEERRMLLLTGYGERLRGLDREELADLEPAVALGPAGGAPGVAGGLLIEPEWHVRPESLCAGLTAFLRQAGVDIVEQSAVHSIRSRGATAVALDTQSGAIEADEFLLCAGAETGRLTAQLGHPLPLQAGKGYSVTIDRPTVTVNRPLYFVDSKLAVTPFAGALRAAGTMELSGINRKINRRRLEALERVAERSVPGILDGERGRPWVGMRPLTPDGLPLIGRIATRDNVYVASGHQMLGMTLGPATGKAMAEWITTGKSVERLEPFAPARFD